MSLPDEFKTKRSSCNCGGEVKSFKNRFSDITVYTEEGPKRCKHLEFRCSDCSKGYFFGYSTEIVNKDLKNDKKVFKKMYEEDCLENEVLVTSHSWADFKRY